MEAAYEIVTAVGNIVEIFQNEFMSALASQSTGGVWIGVDADARARLAKLSREEVNKLRDIFLAVQKSINEVPAVDLTQAELKERIASINKENERFAALNTILEKEILIRKDSKS